MEADWILKVLEDVAATSSRTEKERILDGPLTRPIFQRVMKAALDPFRTYGLTPEKVEGQGECDLSFWGTLDQLATRQLTGNAARDAVAALMREQTPASAEILWRILKKDMRAGFTEGTVNRVRPGTIPVFDVQLSKPYEAKRIKKWPVWVEPKLDGLRTICLVQNGEAKFVSRTGKEFVALAPLKPHVERWMADFGVTDIVIEGEAIDGDFASTSGAVRRKSELALTTEFHVFDLVPLEVFTKGAKSPPFNLRRQTLETARRKLPATSPIRMVPGEFARSHDEVIAIYEKHRDTKLAAFLARDNDSERREEKFKTLLASLGDKVLEGAIVKPLDGLYELKRTWGWMKLKAEETEDLRVVGVFEGEGRFQGMLGGLIVDRNGVSVRVGGGFSDEQRRELWSGGVKVCNRLIEVEFHEVIKETGSLRHPRFLRFRDDLPNPYLP